MSDRSLPELYREDPDHRARGGFMGVKAFEAAASSLVYVCTDAMIVDRGRRVLYLAKRRVEPDNWWWMIGGRMLVGETELESVGRCFRRETSLLLPTRRFEFLRTNRYWRRRRRKRSENKGLDVYGHVFTIELNREECAWASRSLDPDEYESSLGLREFDRKTLVRENGHRALLDIYDQFFGK